MKIPKVLAAFGSDELEKVERLLAARVAYMGSRKLEEGDWSDVYCKAKGIPVSGWSNLQIDVMHDGLGIEQKMLRVNSVRDALGSRKMHPAATRSIRIPEGEEDPNRVLVDVLTQYGTLIEERKKAVAETSDTRAADVRFGWLLWQNDLVEFAYFEEEMLSPDPGDYRAEWRESGGGARKKSRNLWIYEKDTGVKRYSVTTQAGVKIQPYFDIPDVGTEGLYLIRAQGRPSSGGNVRVCITETAAHELEGELGGLTSDKVSDAIYSVRDAIADGSCDVVRDADASRELVLPQAAYTELGRLFPDATDDLKFQQLSENYRHVSRRTKEGPDEPGE